MKADHGTVRAARPGGSRLGRDVGLTPLNLLSAYLKEPTAAGLERIIAYYRLAGQLASRFDERSEEAAIAGFRDELERLAEGDHDLWASLIAALMRAGRRRELRRIIGLSPWDGKTLALFDGRGRVSVEGDAAAFLSRGRRPAWRKRRGKEVFYVFDPE